MKHVLFRQVRIADKASAHNGQLRDVAVKDGKITAIGTSLAAEGAEVIEEQGAWLSPGWLDMRVNFRDPGEEQKEDLQTGCEAAAAGGFTAVGLLPETEPLLATKSIIDYVLNRSRMHPVEVLPIASISADKEQTRLADMYDVFNAGAVAFSSGYKALHDSAFLLRAMQYVQPLGVALFLYPEDKSLAGTGVVNEGTANLHTGLRGRPPVAEEIEVKRVLALVRYEPVRIHFSCITTRKAVELIAEAKAEGLPVTASVSVHHLQFSDEDLLDFNTNLKLRPPLRTPNDREALRKGVLDGTIDAIVSDHAPHEEDRKRCEFELAAYGASGVQTVFSQLIGIFGEERIDDFLPAISSRPRTIMGQSDVSIAEGETASFTLFHPALGWTLDEKTNRSRSRNSPLWKQSLKGRALGIYSKGMYKAV